MATNVSAPLPDVDLASYVTLTVDAGDPGAVITSFVIHVRQDVPLPDEPVPDFLPLFTYGAAQ